MVLHKTTVSASTQDFWKPCLNISFINTLINNVYLVRQCPLSISSFYHAMFPLCRMPEKQGNVLVMLVIKTDLFYKTTISRLHKVRYSSCTHFSTCALLSSREKSNVNLLSKIRDYSSCHFYFVEIDYALYAS